MNHSKPSSVAWNRQRGNRDALPAEVVLWLPRKREREWNRRTLWFFAAALGLQVFGAGKGSNPVLPTQLNLDDFERLVARMVVKILEQDPARQKWDVKGA
jgi:hypothetical protein